ncbi:DUF2705 family protein [Flavobacterium sp. AC]|uniref:DUF2705 family protein n=1 Tax=Flavobacterium azizsancarii TaxID=2961580 RepID=A0ABT4WJX0_9FLAO|nr:DUF2705 family protein [Flavobacterium azizsancarii]MDA6072793.1 DUF2705 family protein [Flavobacterium azizsancarii]
MRILVLVYRIISLLFISKLYGDEKWIKRKLIVIITAFMLGMVNGMNEEDQTIRGNQNYTEQHKKEWYSSCFY